MGPLPGSKLPLNAQALRFLHHELPCAASKSSGLHPAENKGGMDFMLSSSRSHELFAFLPSSEAQGRGHADLAARGWAYFRVFGAPAAGPRNKCTMGLDVKLRALARAGAFEDSQERWFVGGSLAAIRFSALITGCVTGQPATERLQEAFTRMVYQPSMSKAEARQLLKNMMDNLYILAAPRPADIVYHKQFRIAIMVTQIFPWATLLNERQLKAVFYTFLAINTAVPSIVNQLQRRVCFYTGPEPPPFRDDDVLYVPLTEHNYYQVLHATSCIPFLSVPCTYIPGLGRGLFYDGALSDYHLHANFQDPELPALLLSSGCAGEPVLARVWDSFVPWRTMFKGAPYKNLSLLSPTHEYAKQLPRQKLPMIKDFFDPEYMENPEARFAAWQRAFQLSVNAMPDHPLEASIVHKGTASHLSSPSTYALHLAVQALSKLHQTSIGMLSRTTYSWGNWALRSWSKWGGWASTAASGHDDGTSSITSSSSSEQDLLLHSHNSQGDSAAGARTGKAWRKTGSSDAHSRSSGNSSAGNSCGAYSSDGRTGEGFPSGPTSNTGKNETGIDMRVFLGGGKSFEDDSAQPS